MGSEGSSGCCVEGTESSALCMSGGWVCPGGSYLLSECARIDPVCEGPMSDAGPPDAGLRPCDAGPIAACLRGYDPEGECCLTGDTTPALCNPSGGLVCPSGYFFDTACGRTDPICEGPAPGPYDDCDATSECELTIASCCGSCGVPTREDIAAVNTERSSDHYRDVACPASAEGPVDCPACEGMQDPHLVATCDMMPFRPVCAVVDFAASPYSDCTTAEDCVLATPSCCACGAIDAAQTIAVRSDQASQINAVTCDLGDTCSDPCVPTFAPDLTPVCNAGRCEVLRGDIGG